MASVDDNEELIATRKLNGLDDNLYKENDIEKDIQRCEKLTEPQNANWIGISNQLAIAHLIERIKELEQKNEYLKYLYDDCCKCLLDTIEKQKVKDKIEELKKHYNTDNNIRIYTLKDSYELQATVLEELLEEDKQ